MKYQDFEAIMTPARMSRYRIACGGNGRKALTLYRRNLQLSQEMFTIISCFEVTLRNAIDKHCQITLGSDWLKDGAGAGGIFDTPQCQETQSIIHGVLKQFQKNHTPYSHQKLIAELGFGFWRYMFAKQYFTATGKSLLKIFPSKPTSTPSIQYNHSFIFNHLADINNLRNRIAHHEPICFLPGQPVKDTGYVRQHYGQIQQLFRWMGIDEKSLLYGLDHITAICRSIDTL